jgi:hypothetical protein
MSLRAQCSPLVKGVFLQFASSLRSECDLARGVPTLICESTLLGTTRPKLNCDTSRHYLQVSGSMRDFGLLFIPTRHVAGLH